MSIHSQPGYQLLAKKPTLAKLNKVEKEIKAILPGCQVVLCEYTFTNPHIYQLFVDINKAARKRIAQIVKKHFPENGGKKKNG